MRALRFTPQARADIAAVGRYSRKTWGAAKGREYSVALAERLMRLRTRPSVGRARPDIDPLVRGLRSNRHIVFYDVLPDTVVILRVLHERMDVVTLMTGKLEALRRAGTA